MPERLQHKAAPATNWQAALGLKTESQDDDLGKYCLNFHTIGQNSINPGRSLGNSVFVFYFHWKNFNLVRLDEGGTF